MDVSRLRNWARAYQRLMQGGLAVEAHTAAVDDFASDEGEYPYITAADVLALLDRLEVAESAVARVRELTQAIRSESPTTGRFIAESIDAALDGPR